MSDPVRTGPPPETTGYVQQSNPHFYPTPVARQPSVDESSPPMIPTPGGSPTTPYSDAIPSQPLQQPQGGWWGTLPGGHQGNYPTGPSYPSVLPPVPNQQMAHPWYPPPGPGPQLMPGHVNKEQYDSDQKEIYDLRREIRELKMDLRQKQDEHDDAIHQVRRELKLEHREKMEAQQQQMIELEKLVDELRQQVQDATHSVPSEPKQKYSSNTSPWRPPPVVQSPPQVKRAPRVPSPTVDSIEDCPMQCGFSGCRDLLQVHMFERHPEVFEDEGPSLPVPNRTGNEGGGNEPKSNAKKRTITMVLPGNTREKFDIAEMATVLEFNKKVQEVTGKERGRLNLVIGGHLLHGGAPLSENWLSIVPQNNKQVQEIIMMCQFRPG